MSTDFGHKAEILFDLWVNHGDNEEFEEFIDNNDLGLPMAYFIHKGYVQSTSMAENLINETFSSLLEMFDAEDEGFKGLQQILDL